MDHINYKRWVDLFQKKAKNLKDLEILREIDIGYNSKVYLISIDEKKYAVKMFDERFNGTAVCQTESNNIQKARKVIPDAVPRVLFCSNYVENKFRREIMVMENAKGIPINEKNLDEKVYENLISVLKRLHSTRTGKINISNEKKRIDECRNTIIEFLKNEDIIAKKRVIKHLDTLREYYFEKTIFNFQKTIIHGDLWWDNILVDSGKIRIIDWLESSEQDYCRDLAQLQIGVLNELFDSEKSQYFFKKILNTYKREFNDEKIFERIRYYLSVMYLEEAFYLPFKFFNWEIKYRENGETFKNRVIEYFQKSEFYFTNNI